MALGGDGAVAPFVGAKVLVVEDDAVIAMEIETTLREVGCTPLGPLASIAGALATLKTERPDAVLLDLGLADGRATPVAEALAAGGVPFALLTGYAETDLEGALASVPLLAKPFELDAIERTVGQLLDEHRAARRTLPSVEELEARRG